MNVNECHRSEENSETAHERQASKQCSDNKGALGHSNQEFLMAPFYVPQLRPHDPASTVVSYPPNAAYSDYFMPPYQCFTIAACWVTIQHAGHIYQPTIAFSCLSTNSAKTASSREPYQSVPFFRESTT